MHNTILWLVFTYTLSPEVIALYFLQREVIQKCFDEFDDQKY